MNKFKYFEPERIDGFCSVLQDQREGAVILAGGTDLVPRMKRGLISPVSVINVARIASLQGIEQGEEGVKIGAMVPLAALENHSLLASPYSALHKASSHVASPSLRNVATLGGNVCLGTKCIYADQVQTWRRALDPCLKRGGKSCFVVRGGKTCHASLASDTIAALIALGAKGTIVSPSGERTIPLEELYTGNGVHPLSLGYGELLSQIVLPPLPPGARSTYLRYSFRKAIDFPLVSAGFYMEQEGGVCVQARIVLGAVAPMPIRLSELEGHLKGKRVTPDLLRERSEEAPKEALKKSKSGRIDAFVRGMVTHLVYQGLMEVSGQR